MSPLAARNSRREPSSHQLRLFLILVQERHFGRAAARMFMTQPAFSQQIRALEERLGVRLVDRTSHSAELTEAGMNLLPDIQAVIEAVDRLRRNSDLHARQIGGHLTLGSIGAESAMPYTEAILTELHRRHPQITVELRALDLVEQTEALMTGDVDAAFLRIPVPPHFQTLQLATEPRVVCLPADDPLAAQSQLTLAQLAGHLVADVPQGAPREWWDDWTVNPRPDGTQVRYGPVAADIEAILLAVARGQAIAFLPAAARRLYPRPGVAYRDVTDLAHSTAVLVWLPKNRDRLTVAALRAAARAALRSVSSSNAVS